jgi:hypothetical protein
MDLPVTVAILFECTVKEFQFPWEKVDSKKWLLASDGVYIQFGVGGFPLHSCTQW